MAEPIEVPFPHCPHCDAEVPAPALFSWEHGPWVIFCVFCSVCLKTIHLQIMPAAAAAAIVAATAEASPIIRN